jgi:hypothetical protein
MTAFMGYPWVRDILMANRSKFKYLQEPLFEEMKREVCYVCYDRIKADEGVHIGKGKWRHERCKPGSTNWLKSKVGRESTLAGYFHPEEQGNI